MHRELNLELSAIFFFPLSPWVKFNMDFYSDQLHYLNKMYLEHTIIMIKLKVIVEIILLYAVVIYIFDLS